MVVEQVKAVLLVGGATRMPAVRNLVREITKMVRPCAASLWKRNGGIPTLLTTVFIQESSTNRLLRVSGLPPPPHESPFYPQF